MLARGGVIALGLWGAVLSDGERATANAGPFPACPQDMYIMREAAPGSGVQLNVVDVKNNFALIQANVTNVQNSYNAAGFNEVDNYIYAVKINSRKLLKIDSDGLVTELSSPGDIHPDVENNLPASTNSADIGPNGMMYIFGADGYMYQLDLNNLKDANALMRVRVDGGQNGFADIAYHDGKLYGVNNGNPTQYLVAIRIDQAQWAVNGTSPIAKEPVGQPGEGIFFGMPQADQPKPVPGEPPFAFGAMFGGSNGVYGNANAGGFYHFDLNTGHAQKLADSAPTAKNDGAKCYSSPLRLPSDIQLTKTSYPDVSNPTPIFAPGKTTKYQVVVKNLHNIGITGIKLSDPLPTGITNATWTCDSPQVGCVPTTGHGALEAVVDIGSQPGSVVSYTVEIDVPANVTTDLVNTAVMEMPELSLQANDPPQTASVTKIPALLTLEKQGRWVDTNKSNTANAGDHMDYAFTVTNGGQVPMTNIRVIDPMVTVAPPSVASLLPSEVATFTATYALLQNDIDNSKIVNTATAEGVLPDGEIVESPPAVSETEFPPAPEVGTKKSGRFLDDVITNEFPDAGEHIEYTVTVKNMGNITMVAYPPIDAGPTIDGRPMTGQMGSFVPDEQIIPPGEERSFTALYTLTDADVSDAAGLIDGVQNTADTPVQTLKEYGEGKAPQRHPLEEPSLVTLPGYAIDKKAQVSQISRGQHVPYVIDVRAVDVSGKATLVDHIPSGFVYVPGSARVAGAAVEPKIERRTLTFDLDVQVGVDTKVEYILAVTGAVPLGAYQNRAQIFQHGQPTKPVSVIASGEVEVIPDPVFDCGDLIGKVFDDRNRNGYQDNDEPGLAGARVVTVQGMLITTDQHGRFNVACADLPNGRIGSTYIMKLDSRSLTTGYRILSENPRTVRLTAGKVSRLNFAASIGRVVRLDINDAAFLPGEISLQPAWEKELAKLIETLETEPSVLRLSYIDAGTERRLAAQRLTHLRNMVSGLWKERSNRYRLEIEAKMITVPSVAVSTP